ncbi:hypothetical protein SAMD00019534_002710 [Acytostelium subglobosum LB1]|uniref:hypothetical protein n=1 Tax=Acytostelium subglobosum LB1 TaxID=1410327 RepID=UPI000645213C|nr:hypothetical protein SAMD00019534_002710 [Acytostelium subglobosum LB1]GAM17096.1 hypothetical protein SAMD00019534_002710 [Acytostelium subglobosum LB1]|eukprot:XP_012759158.1 hypothetical protein SAMD00019534_002710 [Acytostelium subglobosum LB1]
MIHIEPIEIDERSSKMMLHYLKRKHYIILGSGFIFLYIIFLILGLAGPTFYIKETTQLSICPDGLTCINNPPNSTTLHWTGSTGGLTKSNRLLNVYAIPHLNDLQSNPNTSIHSITLQIHVNLVGSEYEEVKNISSIDRIFYGSCKGDRCEALLLASELGIDFPTYSITVDIDPSSNSNLTYVDHITFDLMYVNGAFALLEMISRLLFVIITAGVIAGFIYSLRKLNYRIWTLEQQFVVILLGALFFFNNPIFLLSLITSGAGFRTIDDFFTDLFVTILFYFWFVIFDGIRKNGTELKFTKFYLPKIILTSLFFISSLITMSSLEHGLKTDPLADPTGLADVFALVSVIMLVIFLFYLVYLIAKGWVMTKTLPFINIRLRLLLLLSVIVVTVLAFGVMFSLIGSGGRSSLTFFSFYGLANLYIFALTILYLPHPNSDILYQSTMLRDGAEMPHLKLTEREEEEFNEVYL